MAGSESSPNRAILTAWDHTLQDMVKGNNACSAWPVMDLAGLGKCSTWKYNLPHCFYQCRLFALQYDTKFNIRHASAKMTVFLFDVQGCLAMILCCTSQRLGILQCNTYVYTAAACLVLWELSCRSNACTKCPKGHPEQVCLDGKSVIARI